MKKILLVIVFVCSLLVAGDTAEIKVWGYNSGMSLIYVSKWIQINYNGQNAADVDLLKTALVNKAPRIIFTGESITQGDTLGHGGETYYKIQPLNLGFDGTIEWLKIDKEVKIFREDG